MDISIDWENFLLWFEKCLFIQYAHVLNWIVVYFLSSLYIKNINPLAENKLARIFYFMTGVFTLVIFFFHCLEVFDLIQFQLSILMISWETEDLSRKSLPQQGCSGISAAFSSRHFKGLESFWFIQSVCLQSLSCPLGGWSCELLLLLLWIYIIIWNQVF